MKTNIIILSLALGASTCLLTAQDSTQRPEGQRPPGREGGPGGQGGPHMLPPPILELLDLTTDQQKQVAALEIETKAKFEKLLTAAQLQQLQQSGPPQRESGSGGSGSSGELRVGTGGGGASGGPGGPGGMGGQRMPNPIIEALDLNKDGIIDADEIAKASESLKKLDKNGDGKITREEFDAREPRAPRGPGGPGGPGTPPAPSPGAPPTPAV